jgi:serine/threonine protein phosphatase 1
MSMSKNSFTYVVGDIHGHAEGLLKLIAKIEAHLGNNDKIVFLGDYIDRGPNTKDAINQLTGLRKRYGGRIIFLKGNHELWFAETYNDWTKNSWVIGMNGLSTIRSYSNEAANQIETEIHTIGYRLFERKKNYKLSYQKFFNVMPGEHVNFLIYGLKQYYLGDNLICSHAGINLDRPLSEQTDEDVCWSEPKIMLGSWKGPQTLVIGHRNTAAIDPAMEGKPIIKDYILLLDTGNILTAVRFPDRKIIQS